MSDYIFIETDVALERACSEWKYEKELAIDIECENNLHHYGTHLAIIQISTKKKNWVIDMLAIKNFKSLKQILESPKIIKIFHDVTFDFRILKEVLNCNPKRIFDTSVAAYFLGKKQVGLGSLLEEYFNEKKQSRFQKADWLKRPISKDMLKYAVKDSEYLIKLKSILEDELRKKNRLVWVNEELKWLENQDFSHEKSVYTDIKGSGKLNGAQLSVLKVLYNEREKIAKKLDKPVYFIISNKLLIELSQNPPSSIKNWLSIKSVHPIIKRNAAKLHALVLNAKKHPVSIERPKRTIKKLTKAQERRFDELDVIRKNIAKKLDIQGFLILDRDEMIRLSTGGSIQELKNWQQNLLLSEN